MTGRVPHCKLPTNYYLPTSCSSHLSPSIHPSIEQTTVYATRADFAHDRFHRFALAAQRKLTQKTHFLAPASDSPGVLTLPGDPNSPWPKRASRRPHQREILRALT